MGDKGGKKDKDKAQKQKANQQKKKEKKKQPRLFLRWKWWAQPKRSPPLNMAPDSVKK